MLFRFDDFSLFQSALAHRRDGTLFKSIPNLFSNIRTFVISLLFNPWARKHKDSVELKDSFFWSLGLGKSGFKLFSSMLFFWKAYLIILSVFLMAKCLKEWFSDLLFLWLALKEYRLKYKFMWLATRWRVEVQFKKIKLVFSTETLLFWS